VEPRAEPRPTPAAEPRPEPRLEPKIEVIPEVKSVPRETPPPVDQPRMEPSVAPPAVAPQPQPVAPNIDEANENRLLLTYGQSIWKELRRYQKYPPRARLRGWEGTAVVLLQIAADGKVTGITLGKSSGHDILDEEALDMVRRVSPLPEAPADLRGRALVVTVPIVFRLQS
jgi:periplasmic protein TonB